MTFLTRYKHNFRYAALIAVSAISLTTTGCRLDRCCGSIYEESIGKCISEHRTKCRAADAWDCNPHRCASDHVRQGFIDGFCDVANGRKGCTPAVAPSQYWGWRYTPAEGQIAGQQWLEGYPLGAAAAKADGMAYRVASLNIPTKEQYAASAQAYSAGMQHEEYPEPTRQPGLQGADTIDNTIEFAPREYEQDVEDAVEEAIGDGDATTQANDKPFFDAVDSMQTPRDPETITTEPSTGLKVQTITSDATQQPATKQATISKTLKSAKGEGKATGAVAVAPKRVVEAAKAATPSVTPGAAKTPVAKAAVVKKTATKSTAAKVKAPEAAVTVPEFTLEPNDEVFGFGIE